MAVSDLEARLGMVSLWPTSAIPPTSSDIEQALGNFPPRQREAAQGALSKLNNLYAKRLHNALVGTAPAEVDESLISKVKTHILEAADALAPYKRKNTWGKALCLAGNEVAQKVARLDPWQQDSFAVVMAAGYGLVGSAYLARSVGWPLVQDSKSPYSPGVDIVGLDEIARVHFRGIDNNGRPVDGTLIGFLQDLRGFSLVVACIAGPKKNGKRGELYIGKRSNVCGAGAVFERITRHQEAKV